jgi:hypothetical protein
MNKAVQQYINKVYNRYDINQQSTDDVHVLKATATLKPVKQVTGKVAQKEKFVYVVDLPEDYMHLLNCIVEFEVQNNFKCYNQGDHIDFPARRLTADMAAGILHNVYMKPDYKRPYFYINNVNLPFQIAPDIASEYHTQAIEPDVTDLDNLDQDGNIMTVARTSAVSFKPNTNEYADAYKQTNTRKANASVVRMELRFGNDDRIFTPYMVYIDYIKAPMFIRLTYDEITATEDTTRLLEFPDYVCFEIVNEFVKLLMENASDPRLQTNYAINQTVADPTAPPPQSQSSRDKS